MKSNKYISGLFVATLLISSCNSDDMPTIVGDNNVKVSATVSGMQTRTNAEGNGGSFSAGDKIVLTNTTNNTTATYVTVDGNGSFAPEGEDAVTWQPSVKNSFRAYSPTTASYESFEIPSDQSTVEGIRSADWLKAEALNVVRPNDATLAIDFKHQLAKVTMTITEYTGSMADANVASFTPTNVTLNSAAKVVGEGAEYGLHAIAPYVVVDNGAGKHSFVALVAPRAYKSGDEFMSFTLNGRTYKVMANSDLCNDDFLKAGKNYCFNLNVEGVEEIGIGNVSVLDWEQGNVVNNTGGNLSTPYQEGSVTIDPNDSTHAIIQCDSYGDNLIRLYYEYVDSSTTITKVTIKGLQKAVQIYNNPWPQIREKGLSVVVEDAETINFQTTGFDFNVPQNMTFTDATSLLCFIGGELDLTYSYDTKTYEYSYVSYDHTFKVLKPLEYVTSWILDYSYLLNNDANFPIDLYPDNSKSEMTLYLSANQKKMVLDEVIEDYTYGGNTSYTSDLHIYRSSDENFWASSETEKTNFEFCGITYKKIIKIQ